MARPSNPGRLFSAWILAWLAVAAGAAPHRTPPRAPAGNAFGMSGGNLPGAAR